MPIQVSKELRFTTGRAVPLDDAVVESFLWLARKVRYEHQKEVLETFKRHFCRSAGEPYASSSDLGWAETDLARDAMMAAVDAAGFICAFCDACEELEQMGAVVPDHAVVNSLLGDHRAPFRINGSALVPGSSFVPPPTPDPSAESVVDQALSDARSLIGQSGAPRAVDRLHTAFHAYLESVCRSAGIDVGEDEPTQRLFKALRSEHPAFRPTGPRAQDVARVLQSMASVVDSMSTIRSKASLAHANPLLDEPEAALVLNAISTLFHYIQACVARTERSARLRTY